MPKYSANTFPWDPRLGTSDKVVCAIAAADLARQVAKVSDETDLEWINNAVGMAQRPDCGHYTIVLEVEDYTSELDLCIHDHDEAELIMQTIRDISSDMLSAISEVRHVADIRREDLN